MSPSKSWADAIKEAWREELRAEMPHCPSCGTTMPFTIQDKQRETSNGRFQFACPEPSCRRMWWMVKGEMVLKWEPRKYGTDSRGIQFCMACFEDEPEVIKPWEECREHNAEARIEGGL